jgi:hypothetical protein
MLTQSGLGWAGPILMLGQIQLSNFLLRFSCFSFLENQEISKWPI